MITILAGNNSFQLQQALRQLEADFVAELGDLALERLDGETATFERIQEALTSLPFLASKKMVMLRAPSANKSFTEQIEGLLAELPETTDLIIIEPKLDKRSAFYKFLKKQSGFTEYNELDASGLASWLVAESEQKQGLIILGDARYLVERVGANQQLLSNELEKLLLHEAHITRQSIDLLTDALPQSTIFNLLEAAFAGQQKRSLQLYAEQRALKVEPQQIVAMLAWQLHVLAVIKAAGPRSGADDFARAAKISPYVVRKSQAIARNLSMPHLKTLISDLLTIDLRSKRLAIDLDEAVQHYLLSLNL